MTEATVHTHNRFNGDNHAIEVGKHERQYHTTKYQKKKSVYFFPLKCSTIFM